MIFFDMAATVLLTDAGERYVTTALFDPKREIHDRVRS